MVYKQKIRMHFSTLMLAFGACVWIGGPLPTQADPAGGVTCLAGGLCNQGQTCCSGLTKCPKSGNCPPMPGEGAFGGKTGTCKNGGTCGKGDECCKGAKPCQLTQGSGGGAFGFCPKV